MIVDHAFTIGKGHQVCEDYAYSKEQTSPFIIVSDGCSSSPFTDIGSRILVHGAKKYLEQILRWHSPELARVMRGHLSESVFQAGRIILGTLDLPVSALDATLLIAYVAGDRVYVLCYGDGYLILKCKDGGIMTYELSYDQNAPIYINVFYDDRIKNYPDPNVYIRQQVQGEGYTDVAWYPDKVQWTEPWYFNNFSISSLSAIYLSTDGLGTFCGKDATPIRQARVVDEVTQLKIPTNNFLKRRVQSMQKMFQGEGIANYDDLGIAAILFDGE